MLSKAVRPSLTNKNKRSGNGEPYCEQFHQWNCIRKAGHPAEACVADGAFQFQKRYDMDKNWNDMDQDRHDTNEQTVCTG